MKRAARGMRGRPVEGGVGCGARRGGKSEEFTHLFAPSHRRCRTQVKNRYRSGAMVTGYMDVNITVVFRGLVCEIQMHVRSFFELKAGQHPCYEACRSLGLAGGLRQDLPPQDLPPWRTRACITGLRFLAGLFAAFMACVYLLFGAYGYGLPELWNEEKWVRVAISCCAAAPYSILAYLITRDTIRSLDRKE